LRIIENNYEPRILYPWKLLFVIGEITFNNKEKLKQSMTIKLAFQKILKGILNIGMKRWEF
jgi:hypothetical protein